MGEVNYAPLIDDMVWSYSRIKAFEDCPYRWYLKYIKKFHGKDMFFSSYGTFMHKLIELYHKGEKTPRQIVDMYLQDFKTEVVGRAPNRKVFSSYFTGGLQYLKALQPFPYGMVGVEKKVDFVVNGIPFVGYIDFLGEKDGDLYVVDNKSRILKPRSSRAKPTKADEELDAYLRQLYIYSAAVEEEYGKTPKSLCFNCFRDMYRKYVQDEIGAKNIADIKYSDIKRFYIHLIKDIGFKPNSMEIIHTILHPVFNVAVRDGFIRTNPTDGVIAEIKKSHNWEKPKRHALTEAQQNRFLDFVSSSKTYKHWMPLFTVMLGTGARIGEILGLRWEDCDFTQNIIDINHNLIYRQQESGKMELHITTPKTRAGTRIIPMFSDVRAALLQIRLKHMEEGFNECEVDGYTNFIFKNRFGEMLNPHVINRALERIIRDCNAEETERAEQEHREPVLLPHFSAHNLRHTFCTRLCENETNLKVIQEIMGHRNIETTMDVYNEATKEKKMSSFANLEGKIRVS